MLDPAVELSKLRDFLQRSGGWYPNEIEEVIEYASSDINEAILDIVADAVAEITDYAISLGVDEFLEDMDVVETSNGNFMITTRSGRMDYAIHRHDMKEDLLRAAETSKSGDRYKRVPVEGRSSTGARDIFAAMQAIQQTQRERREELIKESLARRSDRARAVAGRFRSTLEQRLRKMHQVRMGALRAGGNIRPSSTKRVVTVSDKQPRESWTSTVEHVDLTSEILRVNQRIEQETSAAINNIIYMYQSEFM